MEGDGEAAIIDAGAVPNGPRQTSAIAPLFALASMFSVQLGAGLSRPVMEALGSLGTTWLRLTVAAVILALISRPRIFAYSRAQWRAAISLGVAMSAMSSCYFMAVERIPLGLATAIDFLGPLGVAAYGMRRLRHLLWPVLAALGVLLLVRNRSGWTVDPTGAVLALGAAIGWACYIVQTKRVGAAFPGLEGLAMSFMVGAVATSPVGIVEASAGLTFGHLAAVAGLAVLVPLLPFALEMTALRRMTTRTFGVLMSAEPAIGALIGLIVLGQYLSLLQWAGIACVTIASIAAVAEKS